MSCVLRVLFCEFCFASCVLRVVFCELCFASCILRVVFCELCFASCVLSLVMDEQQLQAARRLLTECKRTDYKFFPH